MNPANYTSQHPGQYAIMEEHTTPLPTITDGINSTEIPEKNWAALGVLPIVAFVALGNILVILAVKKDHKLRSSTNYFLTSLAAADLLVAITVMPPSLAMIVNNYKWPFPESLCGIWIMLDVCFSTSSILHLCMISLDRYIALANPFRYSNGGWMSKTSSGGWGTDKRGKSKWRAGTALGNNSRKVTKRVAKRIILVWAIAIGIALPLPIMGSQDRNNIFYESMCVINIADFTIYGSLVAFFLPLVVMFVTYSLTIRTLQKQSKLVACLMGKDGSTHRGRSSMTSSVTSRRERGSRGSVGSKWMSSGGNEEDPSSPTETTENGFKNGKYHQSSGSTTELSNGSTESRIKMCCACFGPKQTNQEELSNELLPSDYDEVSKTTLHKSESEGSDTSSDLNQPQAKRSPMLTRANVKPAKAIARFPALKRVSTRRISATMKSRAIATEQRASKVLGMIFTLFCLFWCPFFITNAFSGICDRYGLVCNQELMAKLMNWFVWVGYVSSGVNPCVYTLFSRQFRGTFRKLICCRYSEIGQKRFYRSYAPDGTTGAFSTSSLRPEYQCSMESRDTFRTQSYVPSSGNPRTPTSVYRTLGESVVIRQHKRNQVTRSVDTEILLGKRNSVLDDVVSEPSDKQLQWRTTWHYMLEVGDASVSESDVRQKDDVFDNGRKNSKVKFLEDSSQRYRHRRRLLSEPRLRPQQHSPNVEDGKQNSMERTIKLKTRRGHSVTLDRPSVSRRRHHSSEPGTRLRGVERPRFRFGDSSEDDEYGNNNLNDVFEKNKSEQSDKKARNLSSPDGSTAYEARVRFSPEAGCRSCDADTKNLRSFSAENLGGDKDEDLKTEVRPHAIENCIPPSSKISRTETKHTTSDHGRYRRNQITRLDSGVGESVRNSDSF